MLPINFRVRLAAAALAVMTSTGLLASVVFGMQASSAEQAGPVITLHAASAPVSAVN